MILLLKITKRNGGRRIARKLRDWYAGAIYHIMHRGVRRKPIFEDEMDHQVLLQIIKTSLRKYVGSDPMKKNHWSKIAGFRSYTGFYR